MKQFACWLPLFLLACSGPPGIIPVDVSCEGYRIEGSVVMLFDDTVAGADPMTFECLENEYGRDRDHVYFSARMMPDIDAASFEVLDHGYSRDKARVYFGYYSGLAIKGADPASFQVFDLMMTKDKHSVYSFASLDSIQRLDEVDAGTFERIGNNYRDKNYLFLSTGEIWMSVDTLSEAELRELCQVVPGADE